MAEYSWDNYVNLINDVSPSEQELNFFSSIKCLRPLLQASSPYRPVPFFARLEKGDTTDRLFNKIINTTDTIPNAVGLLRRDENWAKRIERASDAGYSEEQTTADFILLVHLRSDLSGFNNTAHGGIVAAIFDEAMSALALFLKQTATDDREPLFTADLNVSYIAPVKLPCVAQVHIWLKRREGRKWYLRGRLLHENGAIKSVAEALWISTNSKEAL